MEYQAIENYAAIGNMLSLALVGKEGSIDYLCYPDFDSPTVFAALLDADKGGYFCIRPQLDGRNTKQLYLPDSNILLTRFLSDDGIAELADFMPVTEKDDDAAACHQIVRVVHVIHGEIKFLMGCFPRFDYARAEHTVALNNETAAVFQPKRLAPAETKNTTPAMMLKSSVPLQVRDAGLVAEFTLRPGDKAYFVFGAEADGEAAHPLVDEQIDQLLRQTVGYWREWMAKSRYQGRWREMINRSALMLKLLTSRKYGSLIAAPTFGLPEQVGGNRNWDYRYTWLRDSSFSLYAFMRLGFTEEASHFRGWLKNVFDFDAEGGPLQVLYAIDGRCEVPEVSLDHLRGYKDSRPVRVGNAASTQLQLDVYGEMFDAVYLSAKYGDALPHRGWLNVKRTLKWLEQNWNRPDEGIWEIRGGRKDFLHSRLMCWVAFDRAIRLGEKRSLEGPFEWMEHTRDAIVEDIYTNFWNEELQSFVQSKGGNKLDASLLLMPLMRFISATDPQWISTLEAIERELVSDTLVFRYRNDDDLDGLKGTEGTFTACSFWYIECLARAHRVEEARLLFDKMMGYANHVGLYAEELGLNGQHLGNFPQALTHLALISAATYLDRALTGGKLEEWA